MKGDESVVSLKAQRDRLVKRLVQIEGEQKYGVWHDGPEEPRKLRNAIKRIDRKIAKAKKEEK